MLVTLGTKWVNVFVVKPNQVYQAVDSRSRWLNTVLQAVSNNSLG